MANTPKSRATAAAAQSDQPGQVVNLDALELEDPKEPLSVVLGGRRFLLRSSDVIDYRQLIAAYQRAEYGDIRTLVTMLVTDEDREAFDALDLPMHKVQHLVKRYHEHFGLPAKPGEAFASRTF